MQTRLHGVSVKVDFVFERILCLSIEIYMSMLSYLSNGTQILQTVYRYSLCPKQVIFHRVLLDWKVHKQQR